MARARATEHPRSRSKAVLIEETTRGISKFQELLTAIEDFSQEGFPYRDAARAKAELQLRECVRRIFGEHSKEFQTYRNHKLRTTNKSETAQSVAVVKALMQTLEDKKLELQGLKPPPTTDQPAEKSPRTPPQITLVPPTAHITMAPAPASATPPMTLSVAMTTNIGTPATPSSATPQSPHPLPETQLSAPMTVPPPTQTAPQPAPVATQMALPSTKPSASPIAPLSDEKTAMEQPSAPTPLAPSTRQPRTEIPPIASDHMSTQTTFHSEEHPPTAVVPAQSPSAVQAVVEARSTLPRVRQDQLELLRKVCLRFHAVARQLRLRKDYRATLEVEDDYDLQDLLCALLRVEFDEVGTDEWTPPYSEGAPRTTLLLDREQIAVVAKKTRPGLTTKELADHITADSARYSTREKCTTLFCFIYDPEGRIGSPKRLETDMTSVSDRYTVEVLVAPR